MTETGVAGVEENSLATTSSLDRTYKEEDRLTVNDVEALLCRSWTTTNKNLFFHHFHKL